MAEKLETSEGSRLDLPSLGSEDLNRPRQGYLIFDRARRIILQSKGLRSVLRLPDKVPAVSDAVLDLLAAAAGHEQTESWTVPWLRRLTTETTSADDPPLVLLTAVDARTIHGILRPIGDQYWIASFEDVTTRLEAEREMPAIAYKDALTGVGNRSLFEHNLDTALSRLADGEVESVTVLFLDLDRFKVVNDTLGHAVGDLLLRLVSERLVSSLRESDTLARLGGDEFAVLLDHRSGKDVAAALCERIIDLIQRPYLIEGQVINVGVSIGISVAPADGRGRGQLLKSADLALYHSKAAGRGVFNFFTPAMEAKMQQRRSLESDLRKALILRQFELHYQPQIDVGENQIIGLEALLRWRHPQRGLMLPADFLALGEEIGLAVPISDWVLKMVCLEARRWPASMSFAVNISALHFEMGTFAATVAHALDAAGLAGCRLEIEVTEDILLRDGETIRATLGALRLLGVRVAMDSFGTGIASLSQLVNFPFDKIKIDRSLVDMRHDEPKHRAIVHAICALSQSLGISTLAEGVETKEQLADMRSEGCASVQGFYYGKVASADELRAVFSHLCPDRDARQHAENGSQ